MTQREIKFRGKHLTSGDWIYGYLSKYWNSNMDIVFVIIKEADNRLSIATSQIDENTISQFTGLHDKNGKEVFDGDILANSHRDDDDNIYVCEYDNSQASFVFTSPFDGESLEQNDYVSDLVIIGNRYENEELLK